MPVAPFGSWPSPLGPADLTTATIALAGGLVCADGRYWSEGDPEQAGRVSLWHEDAAGLRTELTPGHNVRSRVNEYGGGEWTAAEGLVVWSSLPQGDVWVREAGAIRLLAPAAAPTVTYRWAGFSLAPAHRLVFAVREEHTGSGEPVTTIVALSLDSDNAGGGRVVATGADFYAHPSLGAGDRLAWCEWDHPAMPWDQTRIMVAPLADPSDPLQVGGGTEVSALYPAWAPDGALLFLDDSSGYWTFQRWDAGQVRHLHEVDFDFCGPLWTLAPVPYAVIDENRIGCSWWEDGVARLGVLHHETGGSHLAELASEAVSLSFSGTGGSSLLRCGYPDRPPALVQLDWSSGSLQEVRASAARLLMPQEVSLARPVSFAGAAGPVHAWYYPPTHASHTAPSGEAPPVQVWSHGGPTSFAAPDFDPRVQFWTSRGIGILDVNYSGSTGYGRAYRNRLRGFWGILDVSDCIAAAQSLVAAGEADPDRLSIKGSSAGGFTTLAALTTSTTFAAGISIYGIGDLAALVADTHKFEAHYLDSLIAPYPAGRQVYRDRSPLFHLEALSCPMLILQGADDPVVPPAQATALADAVRAKGLQVRLRIFPGEGHGFRRAETIQAAAQESLDFLASVHGFVPALSP